MYEDSSMEDESNRIINMIKYHSNVADKIVILEERLNVPNQFKIVDLKSNTSKRLNIEKWGSFTEDDIQEEKFIETAQLSTKFVFSKKNSGENSHLLVWLSDGNHNQIYNPILHELLSNDFIIALVHVKNSFTPNIKHLIDEFHNLSHLLAKGNFGKKMHLFADGCLPGLAGLSVHLRNLSMYHCAIFNNAFTDLLQVHKTNPRVNFGYGDLTKAENNDKMLDDSPYHTDAYPHLKNCLFISTSNELGKQNLKFYARAKHFFPKKSNVFWVKGPNDFVSNGLIWLSFLWKEVYSLEKAEKFEASRSSKPTENVFL